jgi:hypothetical protein
MQNRITVFGKALKKTIRVLVRKHYQQGIAQFSPRAGRLRIFAALHNGISLGTLRSAPTHGRAGGTVIPVGGDRFAHITTIEVRNVAG